MPNDRIFDGFSFTKPLVGYTLRVVTATDRIKNDLWQKREATAEIEVILLDEVIPYSDLDPELEDTRKYEAILIDGNGITAFQVIEIKKFNDRYGFTGFGLYSRDGLDDVSLFVGCKMGITLLKFWRKELERFEPARFYVFCKKEKQRRDELFKSIDALEEQLNETEDKLERKKLTDQIEKRKRELYGDWVDYDMDIAFTKAKSIIILEYQKELERGGGYVGWEGRLIDCPHRFELDPNTFQILKTDDTFVVEGEVTIKVDTMEYVSGNFGLRLTLEYYNGEATAELCVISHSETIKYKSVDLESYPEIKELVQKIKQSAKGH